MSDGQAHWGRVLTCIRATRTLEWILGELPRAYTSDLYQQKCDTVYQHVYDSYQGEGKSIYAAG